MHKHKLKKGGQAMIFLLNWGAALHKVWKKQP
jgi:hypothetical protein